MSFSANAAASARAAALAAAEVGRVRDASHRASCHRCGNMRKRNVRCLTCPHIFCQRCAEKVIVEYGVRAFADGCPVCRSRCCCNAPRTATTCPRLYHCYKKVRSAGGERGADARRGGAADAHGSRGGGTTIRAAHRLAPRLAAPPPPLAGSVKQL